MNHRDTFFILPVRVWGITSGLCFLLLAAMQATADDTAVVEFERDVAPIIQEHCIKCHKPGNARGEMSLATAGDLRAAEYIVPNRPDESYVIELVTAAGDDPPEMPKEGPPLSAEQVAVLRQWIAAGAEWPEGVVVREAAAADATWWSLQPIRTVAPPLSETGQAPANPIDQFVWAKLAEVGLAPNPPAEKRSLIRRATYDLTGLPPTPEEVAAFVADDASDAYARLVDRLLASPHYGERWGRHWLDVIRFGESRGFERNEIITNAWPFRDYIIRSFNGDKPFDQLVREHLAGDVIGANDPGVEVGTTFLVAGPYDDVGNDDPAQAAQIRANTIDEMIRATSGAFLGLTAGCARCHDHKFDPILQEDYYGLYATFAGVQHGSRDVATSDQRERRAAELAPLQQQRSELVPQRDALEAAILERANQKLEQYAADWIRESVRRTGTEETFAPVTTTSVRLLVEGQENNPQARTGFGIDEFEVWTPGENPRNVAAAANGGSAAGVSRVANDFANAYSAALTVDGRFGARWIAAGSELTITFARPETIDRVFFSSDRNGDAGGHSVANFVSEYRILVLEDGGKWIEVASSHDRRPVNDAHRRKRLMDGEITDDERARLAEFNRRIRELDAQIAAVPPLPNWWTGNFAAAPGPFHVFVGGDPQRLGATVVPASLRVLGESDAAYRLEQAAGEGERRLALAEWIVDPDNPLTARVLANRLWHYHFGTGIVDTPSDFGYMGSRPTHPELLDWLAGQLLENGWHLKPLHRMIMLSRTYQQSTEFRADAATADADARLLWRYPPRRLSAEEIRDTVLQLTGSLDARMEGPGFRLYRYLQDNVATYVPLDAPGPETYRRAVYHHNARAARVDLMTDFDGPDCAFAAPRRSETTTPLQALTMLNHEFTLDMAAALARRLKAESGSDAGGQVRRAFNLAYVRDPSEEELETCTAFVEAHSLESFCRVLLNTSELIHLN